MKISGKGAVITGAASGIGEGIAEAFVDRGVRVVIADVQIDRANEVAERLSAAGGTAFAFGCDVRDPAAVRALADYAWDALGSVEILCNNAGVTPNGALIDASDDDARWIFDVNVFGVLNGMREFGQRFLAAGNPAWIVNTASHHAIGAPTANVGLYVGTKHAVLGFSEAFRTEMGGKIGVSALCPGIIATELWACERNRPAEYGTGKAIKPEMGELVRELGFPPREVGELVANGIVNEDFWIWTHPQDIDLIEKRYREGVESIRRQWPDGPTALHKQTPSHV